MYQVKDNKDCITLNRYYESNCKTTFLFLQNRISRCAMDCQDAARDRITDKTTESDVQLYKEDMERCVVKCVDTHIAQLPSLEKRLRLGLTKGKYD